MSTVHRLVAVQPVKSIVMAPLADAPGPIAPSTRGKLAGLMITGVQAGPKVCVSVVLLICAFTADPAPALFSVIVHTRAFCAPDLPEMMPVNTADPD